MEETKWSLFQNGRMVQRTQSVNVTHINKKLSHQQMQRMHLTSSKATLAHS